MAAASSVSEKTVEQLQKLSLGSQAKPQNALEATKKVLSNERSVTTLLQDIDTTTGYPSNGYQEVYYGSYNGSTNGWDYNGPANGWDDYFRSVTPDGAERLSGAYGYASFSPYPPPVSPVPTLGHDGLFYGTQHYQYSGPICQQPAPSSSSITANNQLHPVDATKANSKYGANGNTNRSNTRSSYTWHDAYSGGRPRPLTSSSVSITASYNSFTSAGNQNNRSGHFTGLSASPSFINRMYPTNCIYSQYGSTLKTLDVGACELNKYQPTSRGNGLYGYSNLNSYGFNELNRGPRAGQLKNANEIGSVIIAAKGQNLASLVNEDYSAEVPSKELYNQKDFPEEYSEAKFFIIKSYSEDDIHKSIKYSVWTSTHNGNKKLDAAYHESQGKDDVCPVFLFFSVNTSGQFIGVAEMVGPVDFNKTVNYWQQDKWVGCFPVKWHIIKDVPNNILKHITLENNDNKPVTNSRDTQEVQLEQGLQMVKIFKGHASKMSILDDFAFYEKREKMILEKKLKQYQLPKQVLDEKIAESDKEGASNGMPCESINKESLHVDIGEQKPLEESMVPDEMAADDLNTSNGS